MPYEEEEEEEKTTGSDLDLVWFDLDKEGGQATNKLSEQGRRPTSNLADPAADPIADLPLASAEDEDDIAGRGGRGDVRRGFLS